MKRIALILLCLIIHSCNDKQDMQFTLDPSKPIAIGITSLYKSSDENYNFNIYMINHQPVSGIQLELQPTEIFVIDSVSSIEQRINQESNFSVHNNESGTILLFSMTGDKINESKDSDKNRNSILTVYTKLRDDTTTIPDSIWYKSIIADSKGQKLESNSISYELGK